MRRRACSVSPQKLELILIHIVLIDYQNRVSAQVLTVGVEFVITIYTEVETCFNISLLAVEAHDGKLAHCLSCTSGDPSKARTGWNRT